MFSAREDERHPAVVAANQRAIEQAVSKFHETQKGLKHIINSTLIPTLHSETQTKDMESLRKASRTALT